jgi:hypothetical protein
MPKNDKNQTAIAKLEQGKHSVMKPTKNPSQIIELVEAAESMGWNALVPKSQIASVPPGHQLVARKLEFDADRDFYPTGSKKMNGSWTSVFAPHKSALEQIAQAAGITWHPMTGRVDDRSDPHYAEFKAVAIVKDPQTGERSIQTATYSLDLRDGSPRVEEALDIGIHPESKDYKKKMAKAESNLLQRRKHITRLADTGAKLAVIRSSYPIRNDYTGREVRLPFLIVSLVYMPDDAQGRQMQQMMAAQASNMLFGGFGMGDGQGASLSGPPQLPSSPPPRALESDADDAGAGESSELPIRDEKPKGLTELPGTQEFAQMTEGSQVEVLERAIELAEFDYEGFMRELDKPVAPVSALPEGWRKSLYEKVLEAAFLADDSPQGNEVDFDDDDIPF